MIAKALEGNWRLRWPANRAVVLISIVGGLMLGFGARLALGCNVGNFVATIQSLVFSGFVFFLGDGLGHLNRHSAYRGLLDGVYAPL